jgi:hypothetical protein
MLATRVTELPKGPDREYEVEWDRCRIEAVKNRQSVRFFSRRAASYTEKCKSVTKAVADIDARSAAIDGEVVAIEKRIKNKLFSNNKTVSNLEFRIASSFEFYLTPYFLKYFNPTVISLGNGAWIETTSPVTG